MPVNTEAQLTYSANTYDLSSGLTSRVIYVPAADASANFSIVVDASSEIRIGGNVQESTSFTVQLTGYSNMFNFSVKDVSSTSVSYSINFRKVNTNATLTYAAQAYDLSSGLTSKNFFVAAADASANFSIAVDPTANIVVGGQEKGASYTANFALASLPTRQNVFTFIVRENSIEITYTVTFRKSDPAVTVSVTPKNGSAVVEAQIFPLPASTTEATVSLAPADPDARVRFPDLSNAWIATASKTVTRLSVGSTSVTYDVKLADGTEQLNKTIFLEVGMIRTDLTAKRFIAPYVADMDASATANIDYVQQETVAISGVHHEFDVTLPAYADLSTNLVKNLLEAFDVSGLSNSFVVKLRFPEKLKFVLKEVINGAGSVAKQTDNTTTMALRLAADLDAELAKALAINGLVDTLEDYNNTSVITIDSAGGADDMAQGLTDERARRIYTQIPGERYVDLSSDGVTVLSDTPRTSALPLKTGEIITFVFDVNVASMTSSNPNQIPVPNNPGADSGVSYGTNPGKFTSSISTDLPVKRCAVNIKMPSGGANSKGEFRTGIRPWNT
jgi:hypothetical protein